MALLRFSLVGAIGFLVDVAALKLALFAGLGLYVGRLVSFVAAATTTWALNRRYTFAGARGADPRRQWAGYMVAMTFGGSVNYLAYAVCVGFSATCRAEPALGVGLGSLVGLSVNFLSSKYLVFKKDSP